MPARHIPRQPPRDQFSGAEAEAYDRVVRRQRAYDYPTYIASLPEEHRDRVGAAWAPLGNDEAAPEDRVQAYMGAMLNTPEVMDHMSELGVLYRNAGLRGDSYQNADREWIDMVLGQEMGSWGVMYTHMPDGVANGMRIAAVRALREGRDEDLTREELIKARYIRQVLQRTVTPESYQAVEALFGRRGAVEYTGFIGFLIMTISLILAFGAQAERTSQMVDELIQHIENGTLALPDPTARVPAAMGGR